MGLSGVIKDCRKGLGNSIEALFARDLWLTRRTQRRREGVISCNVPYSSGGLQTVIATKTRKKEAATKMRFPIFTVSVTLRFFILQESMELYNLNLGVLSIYLVAQTLVMPSYLL
jgi:hypothetical protein